MLTRDDVLDLLTAGLAPAGDARPGTVAAAGSKRRYFLSEYEIKRMLTGGGKRLTIPSNSILSPLAWDWLTLTGVDVIRE